MRQVLLFLGLLGLSGGGCAETTPSEGTSVTVAAGVASEVVSFELPTGARSVTLVVEGVPEATFALASLTVGGSSEQVEPATAETIRQPYGVGSGVTRQVPRRGTFAFQYPTLASQPLAGTVRVRVISDRAGRVAIRAVTPIGDAHTLHVSLVSFAASAPLDVEPPSIASAREILGAAGVELVVDERVVLEDVGQVEPDSPLVTVGDTFHGLLVRAHAALTTDAVPIVLVELPPGVFGLSAGLPCPPVEDHGYLGIFVDPTFSDWPEGGDRGIGRIVAHELGHALGLPHPEDGDAVTIFDAFDDTNGFDDGLMGSVLLGAPVSDEAVRISPQQSFAMTRSALVR